MRTILSYCKDCGDSEFTNCDKCWICKVCIYITRTSEYYRYTCVDCPVRLCLVDKCQFVIGLDTPCPEHGYTCAICKSSTCVTPPHCNTCDKDEGPLCVIDYEGLGDLYDDSDDSN
jgi:hypothetical protein